MAYVKNPTWVDGQAGGTVISAATLNHIEDGIYSASTTPPPSPYELRGTGSPEGVVAAPVGTYYTDSVGTNGAWRWIKKTGTGTIGWDTQIALGVSLTIADNIDLNTLTIPGTYVRTTGTGSSLALNYPVTGWAGHIAVINGGAAYGLQRATGLIMDSPIGGVGRTEYVRVRFGAGVWKPWQRVHIQGDVGGGDMVGTGSPEGVVTAPVGTYYTDTAGTNGAWRWLKKTGVGNTGWDAVHGDTQWRTLAQWDATGAVSVGALDPAWKGRTGQPGLIQARRIDHAVHYRFSNVAVATATSSAPMLTVPLGFQSDTAAYATAVPRFSAANASTLFYLTHALSRGPNMSTAIDDYMTSGYLTTTTAQAWPTALPGTVVARPRKEPKK